MMKSTFRWGLPLIILAFLLWGSLFLYYPIEIRPLAALQAFLPDGDEIAKITVTDLRLPRALVGMILGANLAVAGGVVTNHYAQPTSLTYITQRELGSQSCHGDRQCV